MKNKTISKDELPEWVYGDVVVKKFSFGGKLRLSGLTTTVTAEGNTIKQSAKEIDSEKMGMHTLIEGIHSVKDVDNYEYLIKPGATPEEKLRFFQGDDVSFEAGMKLLDEVKSINQVVTEEQKKS